MSNKEQIHLLLQLIKEVDNQCGRYIDYDKIPQIEIDITLSKIRSLYDALLVFNQLNKEVDTGMETETEEEEMIEFEIDSDSTPEEEPETKTVKQVETPCIVEEKKAEISEPMIKETVTSDISEPETTDNEDDTLIRIEDPAKEKITAKEDNIAETVVQEESSRKSEMPEAEEVKAESKKEKIPIPAKKEKFSVNDIIAKNQSGSNIANKLQKKPIKNINEAIGLNDKFQLIRELFGGMSDEYSKTIETLNACLSFDDALAYINSRFQWDMEDPTVIKFLEIVNRKYL